MLTVIAAGVTVVALVLSLIGAASGRSSSSSSSSTSEDTTSCSAVTFPRDGISAKLPAMDNAQGRIYYEYSDHMAMQVCNISPEEFNDYVEKIKKAGFTADYEKSSVHYQAKNNDGDEVRVQYGESYKQMTIRIESASYIKEQEEDDAADEEAAKKDEEEAAKQAEEQQKAEEERKKAEEEQKRLEEQEKKAQEEEAKKQQEAQNQNSGGVTPSVKEAMDSYESYMNKYCDFMEKYNSSADKAGMMTDYLKMLQEYSDMTEKIEGLDQSSWTDADLQYYLEVMNRINQRLASIS